MLQWEASMPVPECFFSARSFNARERLQHFGNSYAYLAVLMAKQYGSMSVGNYPLSSEEIRFCDNI